MIIPGILESSVSAIQGKVNRLKGLVEQVHIDVIDGMFVDNVTPDPGDLLDIDFGDLSVDLHLMVEEPINMMENIAALREHVSSLRLIAQIERMSNQAEFVREARKFQCEVGFALDLYTPISSVEPELLQELGCVLVMSVKTGFSDQHFEERSIKRIRSTKSTRGSHQNYHFSIVVDGGMTPETIKECKIAGADEFAVTSFVWEHKDIREALKQLRVAEQS